MMMFPEKGKERKPEKEKNEKGLPPQPVGRNHVKVLEGKTEPAGSGFIRTDSAAA